ncbi:MAG TPA: glycosyltransferase family 39 protein [Thermoanaerobaculia bacterium]|nr:glycosyltransferase family 39 protein [Thermoanaerobaculia bacterium]
MPSLLATGVLLRFLAAFPSHKYTFDADCMLGALGAFKVLRGEHLAFHVGVRLGSLVSYELALLFRVFGCSRSTLAAQPVVVNALTLVVWWLFLRQALKRRAAVIALLFAALPWPAFTFWTYMPNGSPENLLFCATTLWLACRLAHGTGGRPTALGLGLVIGLGFWNSFQTLECTIPGLFWLFYHRTLRRDRAFTPLLVAGFLLGASPWIAFNIRHPLGSFHGNFGARPAKIDLMLDNGRHFLTHDLPDLVAAPDPENDFNPPNRVAAALRLPVLAISCLALLFLLVAPLSWWRGRWPSGEAETACGGIPFLLAMVPLTTFAITMISEAGAHRVLTVRYVLPIALVLPAGLALVLVTIAARWRWLAAAITALVLAFSLAGTLFPWTRSRLLWAANAAGDRRLLATLSQHHVAAVTGGYWKVYPINFLSGEKILGIPVEGADFYGEAAKLPANPIDWALLSLQPAEIDAWVRHARLAGEKIRVPPLYSLFLVRRDPAPGQPPTQVLQNLQAAYFGAGLPFLSRK